MKTLTATIIRISPKNLLVGILALASVACSDVALEPQVFKAYSKASTTVDFCTSDAGAIKSHLKFIFIVDRSGSNLGISSPGTDILGPAPTFSSRRFDPIIDFAKNFPIEPGQENYVWWSMANFATQPGNVFPLTIDKDQFAIDMDTEKLGTPSNDGGGTNYFGALDSLKQRITNDINQAKNKKPKESSSYVIFFLSDGAPRVSNGTSLYLQDLPTIKQKIKGIVTLEDLHRDVVDSITFSTIHYFNTPDAVAENYLREMAKEGGGDFLQSNANEKIDFSRFTLPKLDQRFSLQEIWVQNVSTRWVNANLEGDSDMDGLSDVEEVRLQSDPFNPDSDGNGVSDGVWTQVTGIPCANSDYNTNGCPTNGSSVGTPLNCSGLSDPLGDDDGDHLNNCEERILGSNIDDADTNKDYIPDSLAFTHDINIVNGSFAATLDTDFDKLTNYREIKYNLPIKVHNEDVDGAFRMIYQGGLTTRDAVRDCYHFDMFNIATRSNTDTLRVFLIENSLLAERRLIRSAELTYDNGYVAFKDTDFVTLKSSR